MKEFGHAVAPVANCCQEKYGSQVKEEMPVKEFCDYWKNRSEGGDDSSQILYLKDWHFWLFHHTRPMKHQSILNLIG